MGYVSDCGVQRLLANHHPPFEGDEYAIMKFIVARNALHGQYSSRVPVEHDKSEEYRVGHSVLRACLACSNNALSYCRSNGGVPSPVYPIVIYTTVVRREKKHIASVLLRDTPKTSEGFAAAIKERRRLDIDDYVRSAVKKLNRNGVCDRTDEHVSETAVSGYLEDLNRRYRSLSGTAGKIFRSVMPRGNDKLAQHVYSDIVALSQEILSDSDLEFIYSGMAQDDVLIELWEDVFRKIELPLSAVSILKTHMRSRKSRPTSS